MTDWRMPWWHFAAERPELATAYEQELQRELSPGHPLFGVPLAAVGKHDLSDDVLFALQDGTGRCAVVHLTWTGHAEPPPWPGHHLYADFAKFAAKRMQPDHELHSGPP